MTLRHTEKFLLAAAIASVMPIVQPEPAYAAVLSRWGMDGSTTAANAVQGAPAGKVERAQLVDGHDASSGKALAFTDWSVVNYLKPDPSLATRVVVPHDSKLVPSFPFRVSAWIYPTADPVYYGGIVEKGQGYGSAYRLILLRGLKVQASLGGQNLRAVGPAPLTLNAWHEVTLVADGMNLALMVDGKEVAKTPIPSGLKL